MGEGFPSVKTTAQGKSMVSAQHATGTASRSASGEGVTCNYKLPVPCGPQFLAAARDRPASLPSVRATTRDALQTSRRRRRTTVPGSIASLMKNFLFSRVYLALVLREPPRTVLSSLLVVYLTFMFVVLPTLQYNPLCFLTHDY